MSEPAKRKVMLAIPSYDGKITVATYFSTVRDVTLKSGAEFMLKVNMGCCLIARARNLLAMAFMASDCTDLFFIDADLGWPSGSLQRLVEYPVDMVAGVYPKRTDRYTDFPVMWPAGSTSLTGHPETGLLKAAGLPTGFLRIRRHVIEKMIEAYPQTRHVDQDSPMPDKACWALFDHEISDNTYWGEDYTFCRRWARIGGEMWADPDITFEHVGDKTYTGNLWGWLSAGQPGHPLLLKKAQEEAVAQSAAA
jgi:hypothetical protein